MHDFVVIGGGVSGMTAALLLAGAGRKVALVEAAPRTAPLLRGFSRHGVRFDTGFHYTGGLAPGEPLDLFFRHLGLSDAVASFPFREDGFDLFRSVREGFEFRMPAGFDPLREALGDAFPGERDAIGRYLARVRATCDEMPYLNLDAPPDAASAFRRVMGPALGETLDGLTGNALLKALLSMHCLLYGVSPGEVSFALHACIAGGYYQSARGVVGGGPALADAFDARLRATGVDVLCGRAAAGIALDSAGRVGGVRLEDDATIACAGCIATIHPHLLPGLLPAGAFRPAWLKRIAGLEETVSAFMLHCPSGVPVPALAGTNLFVLPDADALRALGNRPLEEGPLYVTAAWREGDPVPRGFTGISPADAGQTGRWDSAGAGRRPEGYRQFKEAVAARMRRHVESTCPELAGATGGPCELSTPLTLRDWCRTPHGGLYGVKHRVGQYNPAPATRLPGLLLAGQGVVSPGVLGAVLSGYLAIGTLLGHERLIEELKACR
jgi:all-trans-retinol 13,14-reductase